MLRERYDKLHGWPRDNPKKKAENNLNNNKQEQKNPATK